jgi:ribonuclease HII
MAAMMKFLIGVDEAGRGPLAGPVAVGLVIVPAFMNIPETFPGVADSKVLEPEKRDELYTLLERYAEYGVVRYSVEYASSRVIDERGITYAVRQCIYRGVRQLAPDPSGHHVRLDGLLKAPAEYEQTTIIGGDASEPVISLASIAAKVKRDRLMHKLSKQYPGYGFEQHKGYATPQHYDAIKKLGLCDIHRKTFGLEDAKVALK